MREVSYNDLMNNVRNYIENEKSLDMISKAFWCANKMHEGQKRQSGEDYIVHPLSVAFILSQMKADSDTICAALLHDTIEDTSMNKEKIANEFNQTIANLVDGVTKISKMNFSSKQQQIATNTRKIITSLEKDVRIIIIKLADRLHNMRTLEYKSEFKQKENALETMEIFVPLAYYIGAYRIKSELEDLSLRYLKPDMNQNLADKKSKLEDDNDACLKKMLYKIQSMLNEKNIPNEIKVRTKNIYGIYKRLSDGHKLSDIHDLFSIKIMVDEIENCYRTLYLVHKEYHPINDKFKDYICNPKTNMYQSLHTTVFAPNDRLVQTQIRTFSMDQIASFGLATYWDIMKGNAREIMQQDLKDKYQFFKSLVEINTVFGDNQEFVSQVKSELFADKIYVYSSKGEIIELPKGATPIDFAYKIHTDIGNTMVAAIVNEEYVPINYTLKNKDRVKIVVDNLSFGPREEWLDMAVTTRARKKIKEFQKGMRF